jgi:hypothetical protein
MSEAVRRNLSWILLGALGGVVLTAAYVCLYPLDSTHYLKYQRIKRGMTLEEVEAILGPGTEIDFREIPEIVVAVDPAEERADHRKASRGRTDPTSRPYPTRLRPVVMGQEVFRWVDDRIRERILVAFKDGKVCETHFWDPNSL